MFYNTIKSWQWSIKLSDLNRGIASDFWHKEDWKDGRREGREFSVHAYLKPDGFPNTMIAVLGFTTILRGFSGVGIWARLSCGRVVLDVPFNPTYGLSLKS